MCEVSELMGRYGELLEILGAPVKLVLATADAYAKFGSRSYAGGASRILRQKVVEVVVFDEAQAYEVDQVTACLSGSSVKTVIWAGDRNQTISTQVPQWTRAPWISSEDTGAESSSAHRPMCEEMDTDTPTDLGVGLQVAGDVATDTANAIKNPEKRLFTSWLEKQTPGCMMLEVSGCKRCGPEITTFISALFPDICAALHASPEAPPTTLVHTFYDSPWQTLPRSPGAEHISFLVNRVMFGRLAVDIESNFVHARSRHVEPQTCNPIVLVIAYLQRHAQPLREYLATFFEQPAIKEQIAPFSAACIKVVLLDSARGMTADYVHVIRASRNPNRHDQYWGIQSDPKREYIAYTRGKYICNMWLEVRPFGHPGQPVARFSPKDHASKGMALANKRNALILSQKLKYEVISGDDREWSWWYQLPHDTSKQTADAIQTGFEACTRMSVDPKSVLGEVFHDPLAAIGGVLSTMRPFLDADLRDVRACGIMQGPAPVTIVDPQLENVESYSLDQALMFAMTIAPALTADLHQTTQQTQLCIPVLMCPGLDTLGTSVESEGEIMLRAFIRVVARVCQEMNIDQALEVFARTHKAESVEILGERWYSKACRSDREAVGLADPSMSGPKRTQVYCYLGGGGLTEASASHVNLAQGVVCKAKKWETAVAVCVAVSLITAAVPGQTTFLEPCFCATDCGESILGPVVGPTSLFEEQDEEPVSAGSSTADDLVNSFMATYEAALHMVWAKIPLSPYLIMNPVDKTESMAHEVLARLRAFGFK